jgi:hypothetical protein
MLRAISLALSELPLRLVEHKLADRRRARGGEPEIVFPFHHAHRILPVWHDGELLLLPWGCRRGERSARNLPPSGWASLETYRAGGWAKWRPQPAFVPATLGLEGRVWFRMREGLLALVVRDGPALRVYPLAEPSTHYYRVMTRSDWMPCLLRELI